MCTHHHCYDDCAVLAQLTTIHSGIARHGWTAAGIRTTDGDPGCIYTIGLTAKNLPELYIEGDPGVLAFMIAGIVDDLLLRPLAFTDGFMIEVFDRFGATIDAMLIDTDPARAVHAHDLYGESHQIRLLEVLLPEDARP